MREQTVGRDRELDGLLEALEHRRGALLTGPIGVGRSHLCREVAMRAKDAGTTTVELHGTAAGRHVPCSALGTLVVHGGRKVTARPGTLRQVLPARSGRGRAALVVVDDVHLVDDTTLAEVLTLARSGVIDVVASCPTASASDPRVQDLWRSDLLDRLAVPSLDRRDADVLLERWLGGPASIALRAAAWAMADGVPLVLREWLAAARASGALRDGDAYWEMERPVVPDERLRDLVSRHIAGVSSGARDALHAIALTEPVPLTLLEDVASAEALAELEQRGLIELADDAPIATTCLPVLAEVLRHDAGPLQRRLVLSRVVEAAATGGGGADPVRVAAWGAEVDVAPTDELAARAAPLALSRFDAPLAERLASQLPPTLGTLLVLGRAVAMQGRVDEGLAHLEQAVRTATDARERVEAHAAIVEVLSMVNGDRAAAMVHLDDALDAIADPDLRRQLEVRSLLVSALDGRFDGALALGPLLDEVSLPPLVEAHCLVAHTLAQSMTGQVDGVLARLDRADQLAATLAFDHPVLQTQVGMNRVLALQTLLRFEEASTLTDGMLDRSRPDLSLAPWLTVDVASLILRGELGRAALRLQQSATLLQRGDAIGMAGITAAASAAVGAIEGRITPADIDRVRTMPAGGEARIDVWLVMAEAWLHARGGDLDAAGRVARAGGQRAVEQDHVVWGAMAMHTATRVGRGADVAAELVEFAGRHGPLVDLMAEHTRAAAEADREALAAVAARWEDAGLTAVAVDTWATVARGMNGCPGPVEARAAVRAHELATRCPSYRAPVLAEVPPPLSRRQGDVARLAARGRSSREIGSALDITPKTVDNHLRAVYSTLEVSGRDELVGVFP